MDAESRSMWADLQKAEANKIKRNVPDLKRMAKDILHESTKTVNAGVPAAAVLLQVATAMATLKWVAGEVSDEQYMNLFQA